MSKYLNDNPTMTYKNFGRPQMMAHHSVFVTHDIPPTAYFGPAIGPDTRAEFRLGDVCGIGLWDSAVDEPIAYPFTSDCHGTCYIPSYRTERVDYPPNLAVLDPNKPVLKASEKCNFTCKFRD